MRWVCLSLIAALASVGGTAFAQGNSPRSDVPASASVAGTHGLLQTVQYGGPGSRWFDRDGWRHRSYWDRRPGGRRYYNQYYRDRDRDAGAALAAGFLGFVLGAAIAGSQNERAYAQSHLGEREWIAECARRYRSFDPASGTYLGYDGYRRYCQL